MSYLTEILLRALTSLRACMISRLSRVTEMSPLSNIYSGGLNAIMGVKNDELYEKEYENISFRRRGYLTKIDGVKIKLVPSK